MKYYLDITFLQEADISLGFIWQKVYQQVHIALADNKIAENVSAIAVSFPQYGDRTFPLGNQLRLLANEESQLTKLNINKWLNRLSDYIKVSSIEKVPPVAEFAYFSRKQFDTNIERLARRMVKRKGVSFDEAMAHYKGFQDKETNLPFINVNSLHTGEKFRLFIAQSKCQEPVDGVFNCYGLSKTATVPWF